MAANPDKLTKIKEYGQSGALFSVDRFADTERLVVGTSEAKVMEVDISVDKPEPKPLTEHTSYVTGAVLAGGCVISGGYDCRMLWWDLEKQSQKHAVETAHGRWIRRVAATPDRALVASIADDMVCRLWDAASGKQVHELRGHQEQTPNHYPSMLYALTISPDGKYLATGDKVGHIVIWEVGTGKQLATIEAPEHYTWDPSQRRHSIGGVRSLAFSADSKLLAVGGMGKVGNIDHLGGKSLVHLFDWQAGKRLHEIQSDKFNGLVEQLYFSPDGKWLLGAGGDHKGFLWFIDPAKGQTIRQDAAPMHVHDFVLDESGETIYTVGHGKIARWEMKG